MDLLKLGREIGAEAERVRWKLRLEPLIAELKCRSGGLHMYAALTLDKLVGELAKPEKPHSSAPTPAPSSPSDEQP